MPPQVRDDVNLGAARKPRRIIGHRHRLVPSGAIRHPEFVYPRVRRGEWVGEAGESGRGPACRRADGGARVAAGKAKLTDVAGDHLALPAIGAAVLAVADAMTVVAVPVAAAVSLNVTSKVCWPWSWGVKV